MTVDYTDLFKKPLPHLWIAYDLHASSVLPWLILDGNNDDETYCRAPSLDSAIRFARAQEASGDATADEDSIRWQLAFRASFDHSVRVPSLGGDQKAGAVTPSTPVPSAIARSTEPAPLPDSSNVIPLGGRP